jgi:hypothetical protein
MSSLELKPTHKVVTAYYDNLAKFDKLGIKHEGTVRSPPSAVRNPAAPATTQTFGQ